MSTLKLHIILFIIAVLLQNVAVAQIKNEATDVPLAPLLESLKDVSLYEVLPILKEEGVTSSDLVGESVPKKISDNFSEFFLNKLEFVHADEMNTDFSNSAYRTLLESWHDFLTSTDSFTSILLCDVLRRADLHYTSSNMLKAYQEQRNPENVKLGDLPLDPESLTVLKGDYESSVTSHHSASALRKASENIWITHGYDIQYNGFVGISEVLKKNIYQLSASTFDLLENPDKIGLALRILATEQLRNFSFPATVLFFEREGDLTSLSYTNTSAFHEVISAQDTKEISFQPLAKFNVGPGDVLLLLGKLGREQDQPIWMNSVF